MSLQTTSTLLSASLYHAYLMEAQKICLCFFFLIW